MNAGDLEATGRRYAAWIARTGLAASTRARYPTTVRTFLEFVAAAGDRYDGALTDPDVRDYAVADYRRHLLTVRKLAPASVASYLAAVSSLYEWLGIGRPDVEGVRIPKAGRRGVTDTERLRAILRVAKRRGPRDHAIILTFMLAGPRLAELVALDVDDVHLTATTGRIDIRHGKGGQPRQVPVPLQARRALKTWIAARHTILDDRRRAGAQADPRTGPLFLSRTGTRIAARTVQDIVAAVGADTGTRLSPHILRHTYGRRWIESGGDLVALKGTLGHARLTSTEIYTQPDDTYLDAQAEKLAIET